MPIYEESCSQCGNAWEWLSTAITDQSPPCPECGGCGQRCVSLSIPKVWTPFTTRNILPEGEPITVRGPGQLAQLESEHKVKLVDDPRESAPKTRFPGPP